MAKIEIIAKTPFASSGPRGIDVYARLLSSELSRLYPMGSILLSHDTPSGKSVNLLHYTFFDLFFLTLWSRRHTTPFLVTIHDVIPLRFPSHFPVGMKGKIRFFMQKRALSRAQAVITDSLASKNDLHHYLSVPLERIYVVPLAPGHRPVTAKLTQSIKKEYHLPDRYILYVGDINWNKNVPGLIRAYGQLNSQETHLVLVGKAFVSSPNTPEFQEIAAAIRESGKTSSIHLLGFVPGHHLGALYRLATLYVQPSWYEGFGFPVLEALSYGVPVLASNQGSLPEVGGSHVHYFDPNRPTDLQSNLRSLLSNKALRNKYLESGLTWSKTFTWSKVAKATYDVYEKVLAQIR